MSKNNKEKLQENIKEDKKKCKKKKTPYEKRKVLMKIFGIFMAFLMIVGTLISIFGMLIYK